jgi:hypothetical protein
MRLSQPNVELNEEQEAEAQRIYERLREAFEEELKTMARFMASKPNRQLFGQTEFELRDRVHELGSSSGPTGSTSSKKSANGWSFCIGARS